MKVDAAGSKIDLPASWDRFWGSLGPKQEPIIYCRCKEYLAKTIRCAILPQIAETHSSELSDHQNTQNLMADSILGVRGGRNHQKPSKINFARFLSSPSTPGPNLAPMDLCGIFGFSSPSTLGPYNSEAMPSD